MLTPDDKSERCVKSVNSNEKRNAEWRRHMLSLQVKSGAMGDRRTKRNRDRSTQKRAAIRDSREG